MTKRPRVIKETPVIDESQPQNGETRQYIENSTPAPPHTPSSNIQHVQPPAPPPTPIAATITPPAAPPPAVTPAAPKKPTAAEKRKEAAKKKQQEERVKKMQEARKKKQLEKEAELERKLEEKILARLNQSKKRTSALRPAEDKKQVHFAAAAAPQDDIAPQIDRSAKAVGRKRDRYQDENQYEDSDNEDSKSQDYYSGDEEDEDEEDEDDEEEDEDDYDDGPVDPRLAAHGKRQKDTKKEYRQRLEHIRSQITQGRRNVYF